MPSVCLEDRSVLHVSGGDAQAFLQGLLSNDIAGGPRYATLLSPQGKVLFDMLVLPAADGVYLDVARARADQLLAQLSKYRLRAKVSIALASDMTVCASWRGAPPRPNAHDDPRTPLLGQRWIASGGQPLPHGAADWHRHRLLLGVPDSIDLEGEFLLDANGEELNAVDFRKGCFVGQEVTARMKHKAQPRRRLVGAEIVDQGARFGDVILNGQGMSAGELKSGLDGRYMASIRLDRIDTMLSLPGGKPVKLTWPDYLEHLKPAD